MLDAPHCGSVPRRFLLIAVALVLLGSAARTFGAQPAAFLPGYSERVWTTQHGLPQNLIRTIVQTRDGYVWIGTSNAGLVRFDGVSFTTFDIASTPGFPSNWISALYEASDGALWIGTGNGLARYHERAFTFFKLGPDGSDNLVRAIDAGPDGRLWVATAGQVVRREGDGWSPIALGSVDIVTALVDRTGTLWIGSPRDLIEWHEGSQRVWTTRDGLPDGSVETLYEDAQGRLWIGSSHGLAFVDRRAGRIRLETTGNIGSMSEDRDGVLWIGGEGEMLSRGADGRIARYRRSDPAEGARIRALVPDREGHLWLGIDGGPGGLIRLRRESISVLTHADGLPCNNVAPVTQGPDGTMWIGTVCIPGGVTAIADDKVVRTLGLPGGVQSLVVDASGQLWAGTFGGQLLRLGARTTGSGARSAGRFRSARSAHCLPSQGAESGSAEHMACSGCRTAAGRRTAPMTDFHTTKCWRSFRRATGRCGSGRPAA